MWLFSCFDASVTAATIFTLVLNILRSDDLGMKFQQSVSPRKFTEKLILKSLN